MPTIRNSEQARRLAQLRWKRRRQREAEEAAEAVRLAEVWADDALSFAVLTKSEQDRLIGTVLRQGAKGAVREVAPSVIIAAAELGIDRATAERIADLAMLLTATAIERNGGPEISLPAPEAWRGEVAWDAVYGPDGKSLVTGEIARESQAEKAEPAGGD
jgi:hypothetical protein